MENIFEPLSDRQKEQAKEIHERFFTNKTISVDEMRLLIRYEKFQLMLARADKEQLERQVAHKSFDEIHTSDFSLKGMFKIAFKKLDKMAAHMSVGASGLHISALEEHIAMLERTLAQWIDDPQKKQKDDDIRKRNDEIVSLLLGRQK